MRVKINPTREKAGFLPPRRVSPFLVWGDFHARSRSARSTIPEEKWGTARSLHVKICRWSKANQKNYASTNINFSFSSRVLAIFVTIWLLQNSCPSPYPNCQRLFTRSFRFCQVIVTSQSPHARKNLWYPGYISRVFATIGSSIFSRGLRALTDCANPCFSPHVRESLFRNPGKFAPGFRNPWLWNPEYSSQRIWNLTSDWNPESKTVLDSLLCGDAFLNLLTRHWLCRGYNLLLFILPFQCCWCGSKEFKRAFPFKM